MLKGKSKIQLFDAETGKKVLEQSDTNLVTNAVETIMNNKDKLSLLSWWRDNTNTSLSPRIAATNAFTMMPLAQSALGGLLLWDSNITEDPSITVPPQGVYEVGHAGAGYSGADIYRGSYNINESGEISGGWRHVWDFDTDKANGTIKCLSLTSQHGGNVGWHGCFDGDTRPFFTNGYFYSGNSYTDATPANNGIRISGANDDALVIYIKRLSDGTLKLLKKSDTQLWYLTTTTDISKVSLNMTQPVVGEKQLLPITLTNSYAAVYVYQNMIHEIALLTTSKLQHRTFNLDTGELISSKEIDLSFSYSTTVLRTPAVYRDGYYYCFIYGGGNVFVKVDESGEEISRLTISGQTVYTWIGGAIIDEYSNNILLTLRDNGISTTAHAVIIRPDGAAFSLERPVSVNYSYPTQFIKLDDMNSPFFFYISSYYSDYIIPLVNTGYIATINNLSAPITKTAAQTMKITYEIYDE